MSNLMTYKNYHAKFEYDSDDNIFVGEVIGIRDSLNFHGESITELKEMFEESIDNYLEMCAFFGKEPDKEYKGNFNVRVTPELHRKAVIAAESKHISLNQFISDAIEEAIDGSQIAEKIITILPQIEKTLTIAKNNLKVRYSDIPVDESSYWRSRVYEC